MNLAVAMSSHILPPGSSLTHRGATPRTVAKAVVRQRMAAITNINQKKKLNRTWLGPAQLEVRLNEGRDRISSIATARDRGIEFDLHRGRNAIAWLNRGDGDGERGWRSVSPETRVWVGAVRDRIRSVPSIGCRTHVPSHLSGEGPGEQARDHVVPGRRRSLSNQPRELP